MKMRGIYSSVTDIRRKVFTEVARLAYEEGDYAEKIAELPYKIVPGSKAVYRESIFLERAIVEERLRLAIGLPLRPIEEQKCDRRKVLRSTACKHNQVCLQRLS